MAVGGYSAGGAYISVLPSLRGFQTKIRADIKAEFPDGLTIDIKPKFDAGTMKAQAGAAARGAGQTVKFKAELDRKSLSDSIVGVAALSRAMRTLTIPAGLVAATPYVISFAASLVQAAGAAALLPAVLVAGGVAAGTFAVGLSGVADTFKELAKADETSAATSVAAGKARKAALESVRSAQVAVEDAQRSADRAAEQGGQQVADARQALAAAVIQADERIASARRALSDAVAAAARDVEAAEADLTRSQERAQLAQESLTRARKDAREELQQLQFSVEGSALAEEEAADRLEEARKRLADAQSGGADTETINDLDRAVRQADLSLREASDRYGDLKTEGAEWARTGIEGSRGVVDAQRQADEANRAVLASDQALTRARLDGDRAVADANAALTKARIDGDRAVSDARRDLGRTIVSVGQQQADAARAVERASLALQQAQDAAGESGSAAADKAALAMAKLSPAARDLVNQVRALGPAWTALRLDVQDRLLAGIGARVNTLGRNYIPVLNSALGLTADGYNRAARETLDWLNQASTTADVKHGMDNVALGINNSSGAMQPLLAAFNDFFVVGSEFLPAMGNSLAGNAIRFREFVAEARESGQIREWIQGGIDAISQFGRIVLNSGSIVRSAFGSINDTGRSTLDILEGITGRAAAALKTPEGAAGLSQFFITVRALVGLFVDKLVQLWPVIISAAGAFAALLIGASPVTDLLFDLATLILPPLLDLIGWLAPALGPAIALFGLWRASVAAATLAIAAWRMAVAFATAVNVAYQLAMGTNLVLTQAQTAAQARFTVVKLVGVVATKAIAAATGLWTAAQWLANTALRVGNSYCRLFTGATIAQTIAMKASAVATRIAAAATWLFNAALRANPIGIVITVLAALVAGLVWAYQNVGWFRDLVDGAWRVIASVSTWLWNTVLKPLWDAFVWTLRNLIGPLVMWLWATIFKPYFDLIGALIKFVWEWIIKPTWDAMVWTIRNLIVPGVQLLWNFIKLAWDSIGIVISGVWRNVIKPTWGLLVGGLNWVGDNFNRVVGWIGDIWNRLRGLLAKPINFMIGTVWNNGIRKAWNLVAGILPGISPIGELPLIAENARGGLYERHNAQIARGGAMRLWAEPETGGEAYIPLAPSKRPRSTSILGEVADRFGYTLAPHDLATFADGGLWRRMFGVVKGQFPAATLNSAYRPGDPGYHGSGRATDLGGPMGAINRWLANTFANSTQLIYTPGINLFRGRPHTYNAGTRADHHDHVHWALENEAMLRGAPGNYAGDSGGGFFDFVGDQIRKWVREIIDPLINRLPHPPPAFAGIPRAAAVKVRDTALDWFLGQSASASAVGPPGAGVERWRPTVHQALRLVGQPMTFDNITLRRMNQESSGNPRAINLTDSNARKGTPSKGLMQVIDPTFRAHRHPATPNDIWNPVSNVAASMRYAVARYGNLPAAYNRAGGYDQGGRLPVGYSTAFNGTDAPELVLPPMETRAYDTLSRLMSSGRLAVGSDDGQAGGTVTNHTWNVYEVNDAAETAMKIQRRQELTVRTGAPL